MKQIIQKALHKAEDFSAVTFVKPVHGGSINESFFVETGHGRYFIKYHTNAPKDFFKAEARGLELIRNTNSVKVPDVLAYSDEKQQAFLLMEWLEGKSRHHTVWTLGDKTAKFHQTISNQHGFPEDTFIGSLPQSNGLYSSWLEYYREKRLKTQLDLGIRQHSITGKRRGKLEKLLSGLGQWIPEYTDASFLHGDLWAGNWLAAENGEPYVIDPSFLYGDRHFDLAFTELFGGFSNEFYQAYQDRFPLADNYEEMKPLYQLYYLLVHLNLFGEAYGSHVDEILKRYAGK